VVEYFLRKHKALSSIPNTTEKKERKEKVKRKTRKSKHI
jgi:hypothetical protein